MNLNELDKTDLEALLELVDQNIESCMKFKKIVRHEEIKDKQDHKIRQLHLLSVKLNNQLGRYE